jgi:hypothetical protein
MTVTQRLAPGLQEVIASDSEALTVVDSGEVSSTPVGAVYFDTFETGAISAPQNGYSWSGTNVSVSSDRGVSGSTFSVKFPFGSGPSLFELTGTLGAYLSEVWFEYYLWVPTNYFHRDGPSSDNNKGFNLWRDAYGSGNGDPLISFELDRGTSGQSNFRPMSTTSTNGTIGNISGHQIPTGTQFFPLVTASGPLTIGAWTRIRLHFKATSAAGAADGVFEMWADDTMIYRKNNGDFAYTLIQGTGASGSFTRNAGTWNGDGASTIPGDAYSFYNGETLVLETTIISVTTTTLTFTGNATGADRVYPTGPVSGQHYPARFHHGRILGAANSGFDEEQDLYVDSLAVYASDPGWI